MRLQPLRTRRITWPGVTANFSRIFEICDPDLPIRYTSLMALQLRQMGLFAKRVYGPVLKIRQRSAYAQNHVSVQRCCKSFTTIVLGDNDWFPVNSHCACAVSRDICVGGKFFPHIWNPWPRFAYSLCYFYGDTIKTNGVIRQNNVYSPLLKITQLSAHAQNDISIERCRKSFTIIVLGDHDFPLTPSNFGNLTAFRAILAIFSLRIRRNSYLWTSG